MRWFLDMCIILYYIGEGDNPNLNKKANNFVNNKKGDFLICYYIKDISLPKWLKRQKILLREAVRKLKNPLYILHSSSESSKLTKRDKKKLKKIIISSRNLTNQEAVSKFEKLYFIIENSINSFLKKYIDEFVIPVNEIEFELKSHLMSFLNLGNSIKNDSDARTLASAIQEHNNMPLIIITSDKKDWNKELLEEVKNHIKLNKKYPNLPEIKYLQDF